MTSILLSILYDCALVLLLITSLPKILYQRIFKGKYREGLAQKFGSGFPDIEKGGRKLIWVHAVSLGETRAVAPLVRELKKFYGNPIIIISSTTETGHQEAEKAIAIADYHVYLPLDFSWIINPVIKKLKPDLLILTETDFWYHFLKTAKAEGAKIVLVNGKVSEKSMKRFLFVRFFSDYLFSQVDLFCIQSGHYLDRFKKLKIDPSKLLVTGNLKFDAVCPFASKEELETWKANLGIAKEDKVLVAGSTHAPEEKLLLEQLKALWNSIPNLKLIIVPRHPERFEEVARIVEAEQLPLLRLSRAANKRGGERVILIDSMGLLRTCYQFADVAIVAGSYTEKVGGHNVIEPCWYGIPTLFGPHMEAQPDLVSLVAQYGAGLQVLPERLAGELAALFLDDRRREELGRGGKQLVEESCGATERTLKAIAQL